MLLGLPCVASAVGGIPSMLANGTEGLLYGDALDADALARAVLQVLHSPDGGAAMGRAARARALQTHDAARNAADLLHIDVYKRQDHAVYPVHGHRVSGVYPAVHALRGRDCCRQA